MAADATIRFDITLDLDGIKTAVASASQAVNSKLAAAFEKTEEKPSIITMIKAFM